MKVESSAGDSARVVGHEVAQQQKPNPNDTRTLKPAQAANEQKRTQDVVDIRTKVESPTVQRKEEHVEGQENVKKSGEQQETRSTQQIKEKKKEEVVSSVLERIDLQKQKAQAQLEGKKEEEERVDREIRTKAGKNLDLLA